MHESYVVSSIIPVDATEEQLLERAASVNYLTDFTVAATLVAAAKARGLKPLPTEKFEIMPGTGARALVGGMELKVGSPRLLIDAKIPVPVSFAEKIRMLSKEGKIVVVVLSGRSLSGALVLSEVLMSEQFSEPIQKQETRTLRQLLRSLMRRG